MTTRRPGDGEEEGGTDCWLGQAGLVSQVRLTDLQCPSSRRVWCVLCLCNMTGLPPLFSPRLLPLPFHPSHYMALPKLWWHFFCVFPDRRQADSSTRCAFCMPSTPYYPSRLCFVNSLKSTPPFYRLCAFSPGSLFLFPLCCAGICKRHHGQAPCLPCLGPILPTARSLVVPGSLISA